MVEKMMFDQRQKAVSIGHALNEQGTGYERILS